MLMLKLRIQNVILRCFLVLNRGGLGLILWARARLRIHTLGSDFCGLEKFTK
jgi:hypothetical protein